MGLRRVLRGNFSDSSWLCTLTSMRRNRPCQDRQPRQRDSTAEEGREELELTGTQRGEAWAGAGSNQGGARGPPTWPGQKLAPGVGAPLGHGGYGAGPRAPGQGRHAKAQHPCPCGQRGFWKPRAPRQEVQSAPPARRTPGWCSSTPLSQQHTGTRQQGPNACQLGLQCLARGLNLSHFKAFREVQGPSALDHGGIGISYPPKLLARAAVQPN